MTARLSKDRLSAIATENRKFVSFCGEGCVCWDKAGPSDIAAYLGHMHDSSTMLGETAEQNVSQINHANDLLGKSTPGRPPGQPELHFDVRIALRGFVQRHRVEEGLTTFSAEATPGEFVLAL